ncbi:hypothetical protein PHLGIDRAFT_484013 [Phlebiopsis gigantea 11061_1 CR5-6]|uniref:Uncharacterized protein n=1 Tax=Phlebiopsis gigantea (strain 11061_1 CR5-6) TaxID=745531 RepID=A0A0C3RWE5_PHLG1|nr:hypothetical protein PHLGIDRAFT_484013 [Phlebiopsis gigantea 11061_1 CR5-6]
MTPNCHRSPKALRSGNLSLGNTGCCSCTDVINVKDKAGCLCNSIRIVHEIKRTGIWHQTIIAAF